MRIATRLLTQRAAMVTRFAAISGVLLVAGCDLAPPETGLEPAPPARGPAAGPALLTQSEIAAALAPDMPDEAAQADALAARAAALRARAAALSTPVFTPADRDRLAGAEGAN